ncbi:reverse transcriptase domain-containing protein [Leptospira mtsangambouensis]|uniref:reverse transcriptase domain-containing protein n=1 Tax=Leptospira mtsangambouensis TaxID=2484912 RepID=UPI001EEB82A8|nr:reverse transcriptase domain-containing protein [Leptospira mtsangambouensis]MCG6142767.1 reverse transcriptase family protein [Leptospira mtsangambouensis]
MESLNFNKIRNIDDLALYFQCTIDTLKNIIENKENYSSRRQIPKKNGGKRRIIIINNFDWSRFLKQIHFSIEKQYPYLDCIEGFLKSKSIKTNASKHINNQYLLTLDIKDFYFSIKYEDIINSFKALGANDTVSEILGQICTYNNLLYPGFNTSPLISNIAFESLDRKICDLCKEKGINYSRYADDLSFSSTNPIEILPIIKQYLSEKAFEINEYKLRFSKHGQAQYVTGLSISDKTMPRLPRKFKRNIRLLLHYAKMNGIENYHKHPKSRHLLTIYGQIMYSYSIEPHFAFKCLKIFNDIKK